MGRSINKNCSILYYLAGDQNKASSRVRGFWIAEELEKKGIHCTLRWKQSKWELLKFAQEIPRYNIIIFQKTYSRYHRWLMKYANYLGKQTYLDLDDAPSRTNSPVTLKNVEAMMRMATGVFVGSKSLYVYAGRFQPHTHLIPSGIKLDNYKYTPKDKSSTNEVVCLGWIGNGAHYKNDLLDILVEPLKNIAKANSIHFKLIGACGEQALHTAFKSIEGLEVEIIDSIDWSDPLCVSTELESIDIGLYPLLPNDFNQYKCGFKALEYMAMGVPVVASDIPGMADYVTDGEDGFLVKNSMEWGDSLKRLLSDSELMYSMGIAGRKRIEKSFSTENSAKTILSVMNKDSSAPFVQDNK